MDSLFDRQTAQRFIDRLNKLTPDTQAQWGKMNVEQMVKHCQPVFKIASGELKLKINPLIRILFGKSAKKQILAEAPFKQNLPTFKEAKIVGKHELETEKKALIALIEKYQAGGPQHIIKDPHPLFGAMTIDEWNVLMVKHLDHHLRQFGA